MSLCCLGCRGGQYDPGWVTWRVKSFVVIQESILHDTKLSSRRSVSPTFSVKYQVFVLLDTGHCWKVGVNNLSSAALTPFSRSREEWQPSVRVFSFNFFFWYEDLKIDYCVKESVWFEYLRQLSSWCSLISTSSLYRILPYHMPIHLFFIAKLFEGLVTQMRIRILQLEWFLVFCFWSFLD